MLRRIKRQYHVQEFWADKDVTFSLEQGDMLGIIGSNGAGKSTLLKAIAGIMELTQGWLKRNGTVAALTAGLRGASTAGGRLSGGASTGSRMDRRCARIPPASRKKHYTAQYGKQFNP